MKCSKEGRQAQSLKAKSHKLFSVVVGKGDNKNQCEPKPPTNFFL
jgi:hypothetical protein